MIHYTGLIRKALAICFDAHKDQVDSGGTPYVFHPLHLAEQMDTETEICICLLHDVLEDSHYTKEDLVREGFPDEVVDTVVLLTRKPGTPYLTYIRSLLGNPLARRVKRADLIHNSDLARLPFIRENDHKRNEKYRKALRILAGKEPD